MNIHFIQSFRKDLLSTWAVPVAVLGVRMSWTKLCSHGAVCLCRKTDGKQIKTQVYVRVSTLKKSSTGYWDREWQSELFQVMRKTSLRRWHLTKGVAGKLWNTWEKSTSAEGQQGQSPWGRSLIGAAEPQGGQCPWSQRGWGCVRTRGQRIFFQLR